MDSNTIIYFTKIKENAIIPQKRKEDAGYDIYACISDAYIKVEPHQTVLLPTGIASAFSSQYYFQLLERSSTGVKGISQRSGVIDSGFRGEWLIAITNLNTYPIYFVNDSAKNEFVQSVKDDQYEQYSLSKAICQAVLLPVPNTMVKEVSYEELISFHSERKSAMFGSTNQNQ